MCLGDHNIVLPKSTNCFVFLEYADYINPKANPKDDNTEPAGFSYCMIRITTITLYSLQYNNTMITLPIKLQKEIHWLK